jgi:hypothetical protein
MALIDIAHLTAANIVGGHFAYNRHKSGHSSEKMTQIYLDSIDAGRIDKANREIISHLFQ